MKQVTKLIIEVENDSVDLLTSGSLRIGEYLFSDISHRFISAAVIKRAVRSAIGKLKNFSVITATLYKGVEFTEGEVVTSYRFINESGKVKCSPLINNRYPDFREVPKDIINTVIEELVFKANSIHLSNNPELHTNIPNPPKHIYVHGLYQEFINPKI
jgi:hypothetical protein